MTILSSLFWNSTISLRIKIREALFAHDRAHPLVLRRAENLRIWRTIAGHCVEKGSRSLFYVLEYM